MSQKIGPRELALRQLREKQDLREKSIVPARDKAALAAKLPPTSGRKPVKRKMKRKGQ